MPAHPVIDAFYRAYNAQDVAAAVALYAPEGAHTEAASGHARQGPEALARGLAGFFAMLSDLRFDILARIPSGSYEVVTYRMTGRMTRAIGPMAPHGRDVVLEGVHLFALQGDLIRQTTDFWDKPALMAQLGQAA